MPTEVSATQGYGVSGFCAVTPIDVSSLLGEAHRVQPPPGHRRETTCWRCLRGRQLLRGDKQGGHLALQHPRGRMPAGGQGEQPVRPGPIATATEARQRSHLKYLRRKLALERSVTTRDTPRVLNRRSTPRSASLTWDAAT